MFSVNHGTNLYRVYFNYANLQTSEPRPTVITKCVISKFSHMDVNNHGVFVPIISEFALCSPQDNFSRSIGRKLSLARALKRFSDDPIIRKLFWDKYFSLTKK